MQLAPPPRKPLERSRLPVALVTITRSSKRNALRTSGDRRKPRGALKAPAARNRARSTLSAFFGWAIGEGLCESNPVAGTNKAEEGKERDRVLNDAEIAAVWLNADSANGYGTILKLLLLTGCRRDEIGGLRWSEIDLNERKITLPGSRTKNGQEHVVPLSDLAMVILAGLTGQRREGRDHVFGRTLGSGFSGWSASKREFDELVKIDPWTVHDLRRTVRTEIDKLGTLPHVCEAVLNHLPEKLIRTYNRNTYETEKRKALDTWAHHLKTIVAQASGANVRKLRG
jgi:integrase